MQKIANALLHEYFSFMKMLIPRSRKIEQITTESKDTISGIILLKSSGSVISFTRLGKPNSFVKF
jgi:hypothetical protein